MASKVSRKSHLATAVFDAAYGGMPNKQQLIAAGEVLEHQAKRERVAAEKTSVLVVPSEATADQVLALRRLQAIQHGDKYYLPLWAETLFAMPNLLTRGKLFGATALMDDDYKRNAVVAEYEDVRLTYTGQSLNQYALRVYAAAIDLVRDIPMGSDVRRIPGKRVSFYHFIEQHLGLTYSDNTHRLVRDCLLRLNEGSLRLHRGSDNISMPRLLTVNFFEPELTAADGVRAVPDYDTRAMSALYGRDIIEISVPEQLAVLFRARAFTRLAKEALADRSELSSWLIWFFAGHSEAKWLPISYLHAQSGSTATPENFADMLKRELDKLQGSAIDGTRVLKYARKRKSGSTPAAICILMSHHSNPEILDAFARSQKRKALAAAA